MPDVSVGNGIGTQAWNTARTEPEALDLSAHALCKSWHPGEGPRVVPTPNQHMKAGDGWWELSVRLDLPSQPWWTRRVNAKATFPFGLVAARTGRCPPLQPGARAPHEAVASLAPCRSCATEGLGWDKWQNCPSLALRWFLGARRREYLPLALLEKPNKTKE